MNPATMRSLLIVALVASASPAFAQSKVYTNADLGKPLTIERPQPSEDALRSLAAHQFGADDDSPILIDTSHPYDVLPMAQQAPSSRSALVTRRSRARASLSSSR